MQRPRLPFCIKAFCLSVEDSLTSTSLTPLRVDGTGPLRNRRGTQGASTSSAQDSRLAVLVHRSADIWMLNASHRFAHLRTSASDDGRVLFDGRAEHRSGLVTRLGAPRSQKSEVPK